MTRIEKTVVVAFVDVAGYAKQAERIADRELADVIDGYYQMVAARVAAAGGTTVKFIGDAALIVFDEARARAAVAALRALKDEVDAYLVGAGWSCQVHVKAHVGPVIAGGFGPDDRFDVIGKTVNTTARLPGGGVTLSPALQAAITP